ncbi:MAG TPA: NAD-dependent epimerase/dehydratase family protein, partial [Mesotoga sp.]|nr:NAD-dependent epimerase/dehydratase family protein [Mesotoga sp.]
MILVTGSTGHVGNVLVKELVSQGESVRAIALPGEDVSMIDLPGVEILRGDIRDRDFVIAACKGIDTVYHLAALISIMPTMKKQVRDVNIGGTENVIHACKAQRVGRLIYTSSIHAFTELEPGSFIDENVPFNPARTSGVYGKSKAEAVLNVLTAAREGLNAVVLCPTGIIGPFDYRLSEMGNMIRLFASGKLRV